MRFILTKVWAADRLERVDPETSKAQLRADIRAARAARARESRDEAAVPNPTDRTEAVPGRPAGVEEAAGRSSTVADSVWALIESSWAGEDLSARSLLAYAGLPGEPSLDAAIDRFLARGGTVFLPVVTAVGQALQFGRVTGSMAALAPHGKWGIREPEPGTTGLLNGEQLLSAEVALDLAFVPALGFGIEGARLGNGGGFYDRTFGPQGEAPLAGRDLPVYGVCFAEELGLSGLAAEGWDLRIDAAVTEEGVHRF
ncbi:hypothetical protein CV023_06250 [Brevibacterium sp. CCUG 69071]|nr:hypothetical protein [Brevibacterium sp. CCUG 69071]